MPDLSEAIEEDRVPPRAWFTLLVLFLLTVLSYVDRGVLSLLIDPIRRDLGLSDVQLSLLLGIAFGLFYATFSVPLGWLVDRWSRRGIVYAGVTCWSLATIACGLARSFGGLFAARFGVGVGEAALAPASYAILTDAFPRRRLAGAMGIMGAAASFGGAISLIGGGALIGWATRLGHVQLPLLGSLAPWQFVFVTVGLPGLLIGPLIFLVPGRAARASSPAPAGAPRPAILPFLRSRRRYLACHFLGFACICTVAYGAGAWTPTYLSRRFGMSIASVGATLGVVQFFASTLGFTGGGWLADRWFARGVKDAHLRLYVIAFPIIAAAGIFSYAFAPNPAAAIAGICVIQLLMPFTGPAAAHLQMTTPRALRGRVSALFLLTFNVVGMVCGPSAVALFTTYAFRDPKLVGLGVAATFAVMAPVGTLLFWLGLRPAREAIRAAEGIP